MSAECALEISRARCTPGGTYCTGSALNPVRVSSAKNPVPNLLCALATREPPLGLTGRVLNTLASWSLLFWILVGLQGSLLQDSVNLPIQEFRMFLPVYPPRRPVIHQQSKRLTISHTSLDIHHDFHLTGCFSLSSRLNFHQDSLSCIGHPRWVSLFLHRIRPSSALPCSSVGDVRFPLRMTAVSYCARPSGTLQ